MCPSLIRNSLRMLYQILILKLSVFSITKPLSLYQFVLTAAHNFTLYSSSVQYTIFCTVVFSVQCQCYSWLSCQFTDVRWVVDTETGVKIMIMNNVALTHATVTQHKWWCSWKS